MKSIDGGLTFTDISNGLPAVTKNIIKHQAFHSKNPLFLGTSLGVYRYDDDTTMWELFNIGLPNVTITDIEINTTDNKITAATYGRGIWQSSIPVELAQNDIKAINLTGVDTQINCSSDIQAQIEVQNNGVNIINSVDITYLIDGIPNNYTWSGTIASEATMSIAIPPITLSKGTHTLSATATIANDTYLLNNDTDERTILVNGLGVSQVVNTFETISEELLVIDAGSNNQYWERGIPIGTLLNNATTPGNKVYGTNLTGNHANNIKSYLFSDCFDLTTLSNPEIKFDMAFDLELDWDIVYMEYSTDEGVNWTILGSATDANWYNSSTTAGQNNNCFNCPGAQWTGTNATLTEYKYNLTPLNTETNIVFRFVFHSDQVVAQEGVIIDNLVITESTLSINEFETTTFSVYPNPSKGIFNISTKIPEFNFSIYDVTGKLILKQDKAKTTNNNYSLDISNYTSGVYFLTITSQNTKVTKKLLLN